MAPSCRELLLRDCGADSAPSEDRAPLQWRMGLPAMAHLTSSTPPSPPLIPPASRTAKAGWQASLTPCLLPAGSQKRASGQQVANPASPSGSLTLPSSMERSTTIPTPYLLSRCHLWTTVSRVPSKERVKGPSHHQPPGHSVRPLSRCRAHGCPLPTVTTRAQEGAEPSPSP